MYNSATIVPAYGRDYKSKRDLPALKTSGVTHLHFRYNKQTLVHVVKL